MVSNNISHYVRIQKWRKFEHFAAFFIIFALPPIGNAEAPPVAVEISVAERKTHVIGDAIDLDWRFINNTNHPLAFMWEGCCRINGKVDMKREGPPPIPKDAPRPRHTGFGTGIYNPSCMHCRLIKQRTAMQVPVAPMGPATAHMFAKPVRLRAGSVETISSRLANWVLLEESGDYVLTGNYLGVHPKQQPQMPRGARLWTEVAVSEPIRLTLLSPVDYLEEREARSDARGVELAMAPVDPVRPFSDLGLSVTLSNRTKTNLTLHWPGQAEFWLLDDQGVRVPESRHVITQYGDPVTLSPGGATRVPLPINAELLAGKSFGEYRAFVELKETDELLRVPSNPIDIRWTLSPETVRALVRDAGDLPEVGLRNPALKLLRLHLPDLRDTLSGLDLTGLGPASANLAQDLRDASQLSRLHPKPGSVAINIALNDRGEPVFQDPAVGQAFGSRISGARDRLARIIDLRRHLGWTVSLSLRISPSAPLDAVDRMLRDIRSELPRLAGRPATKAFNRAATQYSEIAFAVPDASGSPTDILYSPDLAARLRELGTRPLERIVFPPMLTWRETLEAVAPLIDQGRGFQIVIRQ